MYQIATILLIIAATGIIGGWAGYLIDPLSSRGESNQLRKQARTRYMVLGVISAACETASNRDPLPKQDNPLITGAEFDQRVVPIGADRDPDKPYISRVTSMPLL